MTVKELAEFFGKSEGTIRRVARKDVGIDFKNGIPYLFNKTETEKISEKLYKKVPVAVKESIDYTFSKDKGTPLQNGQVNNDISELKEMFKELIKMNMALITNQTQLRLDYKQDYFSLKAFHIKLKQSMPPMSELRLLGKEAVKISNELGKEVRKVDDESYGQVNSYHIDVLNKLFEI